MLTKLSNSAKIALGCFGAIVVLGIFADDETKTNTETTPAASSFSQSGPQQFNQPSQNQNNQVHMSQTQTNAQFSNQNATPQFQHVQSGSNAQAAMDPQQTLIGRWGIQTPNGTTIADYMPNGQVTGLFARPNQKKPTPFRGQWSTKPLGNGRFALSVKVQGMRQNSPPDILRFMPDGNLYNETAKAIAYRVQ